MSVSVAAPARLAARVSQVSPSRIYGAALAFWLVTRALVLVHQGAWPWMNSFVVSAAQGIVIGDWNDAVRPQLPAVLGVPMVLAGASELQMVAVLYVLGSLVQFVAFVVFLRTLFPGRMQEQILALLVFLLIPFNHSIHHYRDMPVVLASAAIFLLGADVVRASRDWERSRSQRHWRARLPWQRSRPAPNGADHPARNGAGRLRSADAAAFGIAAAGSHAPERRVLAADADGTALLASAAGSPAASSSVSAVPADRASLGPPPPARDLFMAKRNFEASREPSHADEKALRERHAGITKVLNVRTVVIIPALMLLGIWSRIEVTAFVGVLLLVLLLVYRRQAIGLTVTYAAGAMFVTGALLFVYRLENVDLGQAWFYTAHTFLDSTPDSWLSPACRANPTENCREADGLGYFGPANLREGVLALALNHPFTTLEKSIRSGWDNAWILFGPNLSTFPGTVPFLVLLFAFVPEVREAYRQVPRVAWVIVVSIVAESVLPPLTWAPPHPQYHVALVLAMVVLLVPALLALVRMPRGRWLALGYLVADAGLSAFRYTRYPGY